MNMKRWLDFFDMSSAQLRFTAVLAAMATTFGAFLFVRTGVVSARSDERLPVVVTDNEMAYTGLFVLDPNTSPVDSLELLPGIGPELAERIDAYRRKDRFVTESDITKVPGIGPKLYERLKPYLKVRGNESL
ncbi:MAG: ComEA family DNA-binding protein [Candidatus Zixiibacteriota bacterium]